MAVSQTNAPRPLPRAFIIVGSVFAVGHLLAIGLLALAAESGPWPTNFGITSKSIGPKFATAISDNVTKPYYLTPLRMTHDYHFKSNMAAPFAAYFEVHLKNERGEIFKTLKFPDEKANFWVRHRQSILAQGLAEDQPVQPPGTEVVAAPGKAMPTVEIWVGNGDVLKLTPTPQNDIPRDRQVIKPSEWSRLLSHSYMRYLCKEHQAASVELVRHSREMVLPDYMFVNRPEAFKELESHFGEYRREE
jgi:hypothetical protein